ncbi:DltD N-terminal domain protein [Hypomontagnella submonticulosa]|nr:DltD N-terminal domain protein [Hypomontagnella submonticulosa]
MHAVQSYEEVEFRTLDGLTLRGALYVGGYNSPAIIMTPGFNMTRDAFAPRVAHYLQQRGITALVYDHRSIGASDGMPRNDINPAQQTADYHDALAFLKSDKRIDPERIGFWGISFSGTVALAAAALDKRAKVVVALCPLTNWELDLSKWRDVMSLAMQDREDQISGHAASSIPMVTAPGYNAAGFLCGMGENALTYLSEIGKRSPSFNIDTTIQTYYNIMNWSPFKLLKFISPTPVLVVMAENDKVSPPADQMTLIYDQIEGPKHAHVVAGRGHLDLADKDNFESVMDVQMDFLRQYLCG